MELRETIAALCAAQGPSGFEDHAAAAAAEVLRPLVDELHTDVLGNLIGVRRCGKENAPLVMLDAHLDQIGLIVTGYEGPFLRFACLGGVDPRMLPALEVEILTKDRMQFGVIDVLPPHVLSEADRSKPIPMDKLYIDAGFSSEEEARAAVPQGTPVCFRTPCFSMGEHQICSRSLDDRSCAAVLLAVAEKIREKKLSVDVAIHLAVQEEVGGGGALTGTYALHPDYGVAVDVTFAETPETPKNKAMRLNGGPAIGVGPYISRRISDRMETLAKERGIPYQIEVMGRGTGTDADEIQTSREGVVTGVVSLPLKYMHTPVEVIDLRDAQATVELLCAWLETLGEED